MELREEYKDMQESLLKANRAFEKLIKESGIMDILNIIVEALNYKLSNISSMEPHFPATQKTNKRQRFNRITKLNWNAQSYIKVNRRTNPRNREFRMKKVC